MESVVKIIGASDEEDGDYNNTLYLTGMAVSSSSARLSFHYDENKKEGYVAFDNLGKYNFIEGYDFTKDLGFMGNIMLHNLSNGQLTSTPIKVHGARTARRLSSTKTRYCSVVSIPLVEPSPAMSSSA